MLTSGLVYHGALIVSFVGLPLSSRTKLPSLSFTGTSDTVNETGFVACSPLRGPDLRSTGLPSASTAGYDPTEEGITPLTGSFTAPKKSIN